MRNGLISEDRFAGVTVYVISKGDIADSNKDNLPCLYDCTADAEYVMTQMEQSSRTKRTVRVATKDERSRGVLVRPKRKVVRGACLVELYEDLDNRKFAISSKAENESEFLAEFSLAYSLLEDWGDRDVVLIRTREFGALMVEICCKYRGYKTEKVQSRTFLIAGDLEIPSVQVDAISPQVFLKTTG